MNASMRPGRRSLPAPRPIHSLAAQVPVSYLLVLWPDSMGDQVPAGAPVEDEGRRSRVIKDSRSATSSCTAAAPFLALDSTPKRIRCTLAQRKLNAIKSVRDRTAMTQTTVLTGQSGHMGWTSPAIAAAALNEKRT
jgi:hypothetical protein